MQIFFTSGIGLDILIKEFEDYITFLIWKSLNTDLQKHYETEIKKNLNKSC